MDFFSQAAIAARKPAGEPVVQQTGAEVRANLSSMAKKRKSLGAAAGPAVRNFAQEQADLEATVANPRYGASDQSGHIHRGGLETYPRGRDKSQSGHEGLF